MKQDNIFSVDLVGRKAAKLGLSPDYDVIVEMLDAAAHLYQSLELYQVGVVGCEMSRMAAGTRADALTRLWNETYMAHKSLESVLKRWSPIGQEIAAQVDREVIEERRAAAEAATSDAFDRGLKDMMGAPEVSPTPEKQPAEVFEFPIQGASSTEIDPTPSEVDEIFKQFIGDQERDMDNDINRGEKAA